MTFSQDEINNSRAGKFNQFLKANPELTQLIPLTEQERDDLIKSPTAVIDNKGNEVRLVLIKALQGNPLAQDRIYTTYLNHQQVLIARILNLLTGKHIAYELRGSLKLGDREEPYKVTVNENAIRIKFDNYIPPVQADEKGEVVNISLREIDNITGVHPVVSGYSSIANRKPTTISLSGAHRTKIRATLDLDLTFASDQWAFVKLIVTFPDRQWKDYTVFVNLVHTKAGEIDAAAKEALTDHLDEQGAKGYKVLLDTTGSDWGPLSKIQLQAKVKAEHDLSSNAR